MRRRVKRPGGQFWVNVGLMALFVAGIWAIGLVRYADEVPATIKDANTKTDAIVVLTGGSGRVNEGLALLDRDLAGKLFISGVYRGLDVRKLLQLARRNTVGLEARIGIGNAINTTGNATETGEWARRQKIKSIRLVTAAYHMPRSLLEFNRILTADIRIVPHPVFPSQFRATGWWRWRGSARLAISEYHKYLVARAEMLLM